jgi:hypothetical protein
MGFSTNFSTDAVDIQSGAQIPAEDRMEPLAKIDGSSRKSEVTER